MGCVASFLSSAAFFSRIFTEDAPVDVLASDDPALLDRGAAAFAGWFAVSTACLFGGGASFSNSGLDLFATDGDWCGACWVVADWM